MRNLSFVFLLLTLSNNIFAQGVWTKKADFPGTNRWIYDRFNQFVIDGKAYIMFPKNAPTKVIEVWEYDAQSDKWTQKANFPGVYKQYAFSLALGSKGYYGLGYDLGVIKDFWEYDPLIDTWNRKSDNSNGIIGGISFCIDNIGYFGITNKDPRLWTYNPKTNVWALQTGYPAIVSISGALVFTIGNKAYIGGGVTDMGIPTPYFYEYNASTNIWTRKTDLPNRGAGLGLSICEFGYNLDSCLYQYNPSKNRWICKAACKYGSGGVNFTIGKKGYTGIGTDSLGNPSNAFWEYTPDDSCTMSSGLDEMNTKTCSIYPNPITT